MINSAYNPDPRNILTVHRKGIQSGICPKEIVTYKIERSKSERPTPNILRKGANRESV
jgi:hypothetical protein